MSTSNSNDVTELDLQAPQTAVPEPGSSSNDAGAVDPMVDAAPEESLSDVFSDFQRTHDRRAGEDGRQIRGTVVVVVAESVFVDIGFKTDSSAYCAAHRFRAGKARQYVAGLGERPRPGWLL